MLADFSLGFFPFQEVSGYNSVGGLLTISMAGAEYYYINAMNSFLILDMKGKEGSLVGVRLRQGLHGHIAKFYA